MLCPKCGDLVVEELNKFCPSCGTELCPTGLSTVHTATNSELSPEKLPLNADMVFCSECGAKILRKASICPKCGVKNSSCPDNNQSTMPMQIVVNNSNNEDGYPKGPKPPNK